jgi:uncharacterized membrane protein
MQWGLFLAVAAIALAPLAAPLLAPSHPFAALLIRSFFSRLCHQNPVRSFVVEGSPVAVCVRCLGIYIGATFGAFLHLPTNRRREMSWNPTLRNERVGWGTRILAAVMARPQAGPLPGRSTAVRWLALALLLNMLDAASGMLAWHGSWPLTRFLLGLLLGLGAGGVLFGPGLALPESLWRKRVMHPPGRPPGLR